MAIITGPGGHDLEGELAALGVRFVHAPGNDAPGDIVAEVLAADERQVRAVVTAQPPQPGQEHSGMGAWHVNAVDEVHFARSGRGLVQFVLPAGLCSVEVIPGDVMIIRRAEHRYRALDPQEWALRHAGPVDRELAPRETGRPAEP